jgi:hypothetical protein
MILTPADLDLRLNALRRLDETDTEAAAAGAEELRIEVLQAIADANPNAIALARIAMLTVSEDIGGD